MSFVAAIQSIEPLIPGLAVAYLYGSEARGEARHDSDVDIAVAAERPLSGDTLRAAREALELALGRDVGLIDLSVAPLPLAREVLRDGRRLHTPDPTFADHLEVRILRDYEDLKRRRSGIEDDIAARGTVYAA